MISLFTLISKKEELKLLEPILHELAAKLTEEYWDMHFFTSYSDVREYLRTEPLIDFGCYDLMAEGASEGLPIFRKAYQNMGLVLVVDDSVSPLSYLKPGIRPDSLLIRPLKEEKVKETLEEFIRSGLEQKRGADGEENFVIETKEGRTFIPYNQIYYLEAREKKIFVRTLNEEYGFYASLEELAEKMPENFMRCHRSFIVNGGRIFKVAGASNMIILERGFEVPLSRSYKPEFRNYGK